MNFQGQFLDQATGQPIPEVHVLQDGRAISIADQNGRFAVDVPAGTLLDGSHVSYGLWPFVVQDPAQFYMVPMRVRTNDLDEFEITASKPWPWWLKALAVGVAGRVLRIW